MNKLWPSPILFVAALFLFVKGCSLQDSGRKYLTENAPQYVGNGSLGAIEAPNSPRADARRDMSTGSIMQVAGGVLGAIGVVLAGLGMLHNRVQTSALSNRLAVTYDFVSAVPSEGGAPEAGLKTEDQAIDELKSRYPSLAKSAADQLRQQFAEKRRLEPTKIWYVKDLQVREVTA